MFAKLTGVWGASSSDGFTVIRCGSPVTEFCIEYSRGGRTLRHALENLAPGSVQPVFVDRIGPWLPPHADVELDHSERRKIAEHMVAAMQFLGDKFVVV
ncbi:hypothetical protein [Dyella humicola]|uniref:hypothetical protein n=1 Tax=Dyella humicola TaxID=2992126 RepID=UPI00224FFAF1|nr:hypothetical protein [Dyella humicola]